MSLEKRCGTVGFQEMLRKVDKRKCAIQLNAILAGLQAYFLRLEEIEESEKKQDSSLI